MIRFKPFTEKYDAIVKSYLPEWKLQVMGTAMMGTDLGVCRYHDKKIWVRNTLRSEKEHVRTVAHEIAHGLNSGHGHDNVWMKSFFTIAKELA